MPQDPFEYLHDETQRNARDILFGYYCKGPCENKSAKNCQRCKDKLGSKLQSLLDAHTEEIIDAVGTLLYPEEYKHLIQEAKKAKEQA